jgi:eukaryotic-like serine/threonine-protein kinase
MLLAPLGSGGSGRVWAAVRVGQLGFTKRMALKLLRHEKLGSSRAVQRFDREAQLGARLNHPNIRAVHDLNSHEGWPYMAMRWVETSLEELLEHAPEHKLPPDVACWLGIQCLAALAAAHAHVDAQGVPCPIIHRDVSPGNILLSAEGHVLVSDLAATIDSDSGSPGSSDARFFGNIAYASPEALNEQALDGRSDVFSLGCVLYQCLSGAPPFVADNEHSLVYQVLTQGPVDLRQRAPEVPEALAAVVRRAMAREPEQRFASADAMANALSGCVEALSAFSLEARTTALIRETLGDRLRAREEAMHLAFQRFSLSQTGRTDTLPIARGYDDVDRGARGSVAVATHTGSGGVVASLPLRLPRGRQLGLLLGLLALLAVLYLRSTVRNPAPSDVAPSAAAGSSAQSETHSLEPAPSSSAARAEAPAVPTLATPPSPAQTAGAALPGPEPPATRNKPRSKKPSTASGSTERTAQASAEAAAAPHLSAEGAPMPSARANTSESPFPIDKTNPYKRKPSLPASSTSPSSAEPSAATRSEATPVEPAGAEAPP